MKYLKTFNEICESTLNESVDSNQELLSKIRSLKNNIGLNEQDMNFLYELNSVIGRTPLRKFLTNGNVDIYAQMYLDEEENKEFRKSMQKIMTRLIPYFDKNLL